MIEIEIRKEDEFIKLGQALKKSRTCGVRSGCQVRDPGWTVTVNGEVETQRGKKLHGGELVSYNGETVKIVR